MAIPCPIYARQASNRYLITCTRLLRSVPGGAVDCRHLSTDLTCSTDRVARASPSNRSLKTLATRRLESEASKGPAVAEFDAAPHSLCLRRLASMDRE